MTNGPFEDLQPYRGLIVEAFISKQWYAAIVTQVLPNNEQGKVSLTVFHPVAGALPYQNFPYWDEQVDDNHRGQVWRFIETQEVED